jgi:glutamate-1-semialdehyde 2,1-aminomutase
MHDREASRDLYDRALSVMPGGVNSPVRAVQPYPSFVERGDGAHVVDADGNRLLDYVMGYGPLLLGHELPDSVTAAIQSAVSEGPMYGAPTEVEVELAEFVARHVPSVEQVRFVNSGTEATVSAVRLARAYTGRDTIVVVDGGYHGAQESTLVDERGAPSSPGIPAAFAEHTVTVPFNDEGAIHSLFADPEAPPAVTDDADAPDRSGRPGVDHEHLAAVDPTDIAAVLVEPILANTGIVHPVEGYHETIRSACDRAGSLLVFDEVITGFRVGGLGCAQGLFDVDPDLTTFGKIVGGGFPVGAIGGRSEVVSHFTPSGEVFQAGTFSGHPVTMAAGLATLEHAAEQDVQEELRDLGDRLRAGLTDVVADHAPEYTVVGRDSLFKVIFTRAAPATFDGHCEAGCRQRPQCPRYEACPKTGADVEATATDRWDRLFRPAMRDEQGVLLTANQKEANFLSAAHTAEDVERTIEAYEAVLSGG